MRNDDEIADGAVPYREISSDAWITALREHIESGSGRWDVGRLRYYLSCPRCSHGFQLEVPKLTRQKITVLCQCSSWHTDRPSGLGGCGAYGNLDLLLGDARHPVIEKAHNATPIDRVWQVKAMQLSLDALSGIRSVAERWLSALATILGLFGLGAIVRQEGTTAAFAVPGLIGLAALVAAVVAAVGLPATRHLFTGRDLRLWERRGHGLSLAALAFSVACLVAFVLAYGAVLTDPPP